VIAEELGLPLGTVKSRLRLALAKLRVMLGAKDE
jgi:DNA-directed RNA polymerase specialized sigma24 family protein